MRQSTGFRSLPAPHCAQAGLEPCVQVALARQSTGVATMGCHLASSGGLSLPAWGPEPVFSRMQASADALRACISRVFTRNDPGCRPAPCVKTRVPRDQCAPTDPKPGPNDRRSESQPKSRVFTRNWRGSPMRASPAQPLGRSSCVRENTGLDVRCPRGPPRIGHPGAPTGSRTGPNPCFEAQSNPRTPCLASVGRPLGPGSVRQNTGPCLELSTSAQARPGTPGQ